MFKRLYNTLQFGLLSRKSGMLANQGRYEESLKALDEMAQIDVPKYEKAGLIISRANTLVIMGRYREALKHYNDFLQKHIQDITIDRDREYLHAYTVLLRDHTARRLDPSHPITISKQKVLELGKKATLVVREDYKLK
jgi:tetratricopeptide (TPR) repeat protein